MRGNPWLGPELKLQRLGSVGGSVRIEDNGNITAIGLSALEVITGQLSILDHPELSTLSVEKLSSVNRGRRRVVLGRY